MLKDSMCISREEAGELGCRYYYSMNRCQNGHRAPRLVSTGKCTECTAKAKAANYKKNKKKISKRHKVNKKSAAGKESAALNKRKTRARKKYAVKRANEIESEVKAKSVPVKRVLRKPLKKDPDEGLEDYVERQANRIESTNDDMYAYIEKLREIRNFTSLCSKKDMEALLAELDKRYPPILIKRIKVCPFCNKHKEFSRLSWYLKHNCPGMKEQAKITERLIAESAGLTVD